MKKIFYIVLFLSFLFSLANAQSKSDKAPLIEFGDELVDLGTVFGDTIITYIFTFKNVGDDTLIIHKVKPG
ncbi:MAG: DUF1573 domain-containing protein [Calditrichaceae bacterium]|nr:DUF1573 domain-containing protein [Calditrichaceae bacterium]MBN2710782.1 DUF1573 domain-containing protein [Calditrichaceae bacterium]RQV94703.1 MAG: DUF1573 domain-containing protein [Calditrichota bacterium]